VRLRPLGTSATNWLIVPASAVDVNECGVVGGMRIGRGNGNTGRKSIPVTLCLPQIPHELACARTPAAVLEMNGILILILRTYYKGHAPLVLTSPFTHLHPTKS
jgi:hypothetical protein